MIVTVKSMDDLSKILEPRIQQAMKMAQKIIADCIQESINEYYKEKAFNDGSSCIPIIYKRTYKLLNSLIKTEITNSDGTLSCQVKIDENYLNYQYPGMFGYSSMSATGLDILTWNSKDGSHGGTVDGDWKIWEQAITALGGETGIMIILASKLKKCGIPIKR